MKQKYGMTILLICLGQLHLAVFAAGFLSPYDVAEQDRELPFAPPTRIHFADARGALHLRPSVCLLLEDSAQFGAYHEDAQKCFPIRFFVDGPQYKLGGVLACTRHLFGVDPPARLFLMEQMDMAGTYSPDFCMEVRFLWPRGCWQRCCLWGSGCYWARPQDFLEDGWTL